MTSQNSPSSWVADGKSAGDISARTTDRVHLAHCYYVGISQLRGSVSLATSHRIALAAHLIGVAVVLGSGAVLQVINVIIQLISVFVVHGLAWLSRAEKGMRDKSVNLRLRDNGAHAQMNDGVAANDRSLQYFSWSETNGVVFTPNVACDTSHASFIAHVVKALKSDDAFPLLHPSNYSGCCR